jgi:hypothetical protein
VANTSLSGVRVARELNWLMIERGKPKMVVSDNGAGAQRHPGAGQAVRHDATQDRWQPEMNFRFQN